MSLFVVCWQIHTHIQTNHNIINNISQSEPSGPNNLFKMNKRKHNVGNFFFFVTHSVIIYLQHWNCFSLFRRGGISSEQWSQFSRHRWNVVLIKKKKKSPSAHFEFLTPKICCPSLPVHSVFALQAPPTSLGDETMKTRISAVIGRSNNTDVFCCLFIFYPSRN